MADFAQILDALIRDALVQTTAILTVGLLAARYVRLPARAHAVLLMAFVAAAATPLASSIVRHGGWGILAPEASVNRESPRLEPIAPPRQDAQVRGELQAEPAATNQFVTEREADFAGAGSTARVAVNARRADLPDEATNEVRVVATIVSPEAVPIADRGMLRWAASLFAVLWLAGTLIAGAAPVAWRRR